MNSGCCTFWCRRNLLILDRFSWQCSHRNDFSFICFGLFFRLGRSFSFDFFAIFSTLISTGVSISFASSKSTNILRSKDVKMLVNKFLSFCFCHLHNTVHIIIYWKVIKTIFGINFRHSRFIVIDVGIWCIGAWWQVAFYLVNRVVVNFIIYALDLFNANIKLMKYIHLQPTLSANITILGSLLFQSKFR